jgi:uncharacterized membrane protein (UPF0127 family)
MTLIVCAAGACRHAAAPGTPSHPEVVLRGASAREVRVAVELARTPGERERGLMYRQKLEAGRGMLFLFPEPSGLKFWMHNTYIALDMIFMDAERRVVYVEENAEPLTDAPRGPERPTQFVLEVPGGFSRAAGIEVGAQARFIGVAE